MQNMDKYRNFTEISEGSKGTAEKKYQSYQEQLQAAQNRLAAAWEKIAQDADIASFITHFVNFSTFMVKHMPTLLKTVTRLIAIWQGYKIPTLMQQGMQFTGLTPLFGAVGGLFKKGKAGFREAVASGNENIRKFVTGESNRFGGGATDKWLETISKQVQAIIGKQQAREGTANEIEEASKEMAANVQIAEKSTEQGVVNEQNKTAEGKKQVDLEKQETQVAGGGAFSAYKGKGGKGMAAASIASGAAGIISGVMTTGGSHYSVNGGTTESSSEASGAMKGVSAGVNALGMIGYIWGPIGGMISQTIASLLEQFATPLIGMWIDADRDARNARVAEAEKQLSILETIKSSVATIEKHSSTAGITYEEQQEIIKTVKEIRKTLTENSDTFTTVVQYMGKRDDKTDWTRQAIYDLLNDWTNRTEEEHREFLSAFQAATETVVSAKEIAAAENKFYEHGSKAKGLTTVYTYKSSTNASGGGGAISSTGDSQEVAALSQWSRETGTDIINKSTFSSGSKNPFLRFLEGLSGGAGTSSSSEYGFKYQNIEDLIQQYKSYVEWLQKEIIEDPAKATMYQQFIDKYQAAIDDYENGLADLNQIYREANEHLTAAALLQTKITTSSGEQIDLLNANMAQLKRLGKSGIYQAVVDQLLASGGFKGFSINSAQGQSIIEQAIKSNEKLYAVWTGQIYTLNEALNSQNTEVLKSFATALGVSVEELENLRGELGKLKLSDILDSPANTRTMISELTSLFTSMASSSGMTAENLETIINKFPELVSDLKDTVSLGGDLLDMIGQYNALYSRQILSDLLNNETVFSNIMQKLKESSPGAFDEFIDSKYEGATRAQDILELLAADWSEGSGVSKETYDLLKSIYGEYFDFTVKSSLGTEAFEAYVSYWNKVWDKQIKNLEEQKSAIQEITKQREYENKLIEARLRLENASKEKKRVYREGVGWVYEADQNAVKEAQENLEQVQQEQTISALDQQIAELNYMKERLDQITENTELENLKGLWDSFLSDQKVKDTLSSYSAVQLLQNVHGDITTIVFEGFKTLKDYFGAKESSYNSVFGSGDKDAWGKLVHARDTMNNIEDKSSEDYYTAQTAYNNALTTYQQDARKYQNQYGTAEGLSQEQTEALTAETVNEAKGRLTIRKNGSEATYTTGELVSANSNPDIYNDIQNTAKNKRSGNDEGSQLETWQYNPGSTVNLDKSGTIITGQSFRDNFGSSLDTWASKAIAEHPQGTLFSKSGDHSMVGIALGEGELGAKHAGMYLLDAARRGSLGLGGGPTLINEEGTEAIITPGGTVTSLPSGTGVVPADITRSLWQLGELAPSILRILGYNGGSQFAGGSGIVNNSDSVNIGSVIMQVSADAGFDPERFVEELKTQAALSKNNRR